MYYSPQGVESNNGGTSAVFTSSAVAIAPLACTISQMNIAGVEDYAGGAETATFTLYYGTSGVSAGTPSSITCTTASIPGGNGNQGSCSDTTHTLAVTAGELLSIREHLSNEDYNTESAFYWTVHLICK